MGGGAGRTGCQGRLEIQVQLQEEALDLQVLRRLGCLTLAGIPDLSGGGAVAVPHTRSPCPARMYHLLSSDHDDRIRVVRCCRARQQHQHVLWQEQGVSLMRARVCQSARVTIIAQRPHATYMLQVHSMQASTLCMIAAVQKLPNCELPKHCSSGMKAREFSMFSSRKGQQRHVMGGAYLLDLSLVLARLELGPVLASASRRLVSTLDSRKLHGMDLSLSHCIPSGYTNPKCMSVR